MRNFFRPRDIRQNLFFDSFSNFLGFWYFSHSITRTLYCPTRLTWEYHCLFLYKFHRVSIHTTTSITSTNIKKIKSEGGDGWNTGCGDGWNTLKTWGWLKHFFTLEFLAIFSPWLGRDLLNCRPREGWRQGVSFDTPSGKSDTPSGKWHSIGLIMADTPSGSPLAPPGPGHIRWCRPLSLWMMKCSLIFHLYSKPWIC